MSQILLIRLMPSLPTNDKKNTVQTMKETPRRSVEGVSNLLTGSRHPAQKPRVKPARSARPPPPKAAAHRFTGVATSAQRACSVWLARTLVCEHALLNWLSEVYQAGRCFSLMCDPGLTRHGAKRKASLPLQSRSYLHATLTHCLCSSCAEGTTWSTDSSSRTSSWLVLRNLTPQVRHPSHHF